MQQASVPSAAAGLLAFRRPSAPPAAWFRYSPNRKGEHPRAHLKGFRGVLQADAYGGWNQIYAGGAVVEAVCWAHARRPRWDLYCETGKSETRSPPRRCAAYARSTTSRTTSEGSRRTSDASSVGPGRPTAARHACVAHEPAGTCVGQIAAGSGHRIQLGALAGADALRGRRHHRDRQPAKRALRGVALGRSNYLFMGSDAGGERAAALYSLVETAKLNGLGRRPAASQSLSANAASRRSTPAPLVEGMQGNVLPATAGQLAGGALQRLMAPWWGKLACPPPGEFEWPSGLAAGSAFAALPERTLGLRAHH